MAKRNRVEDQHHAAAVNVLRLYEMNHGVIFWFTKNEGNCKYSGAMKAWVKKMGIRAGVSDLIILGHGMILFLEIKAPTGRRSPKQKQFKLDVERLGHPYEVLQVETPYHVKPAIDILMKKHFGLTL